MRPIKIGTVFIILIVLLAPKYADSQNTQTDIQQVIADIVEDMTAKSDSEEDYTQLIDDLIQLAENPINLNSANSSDLKKLFFLNDFQITSLIEYRDSTGEFLSIYELQTIIGFDLVDVQKIIPFVKVEKVDKTELAPLRYSRNDLSFRYRTSLQTPAAYQSNYSGLKYLGDKNSYYTRYTLKGGKNLQLGFIAEKDAGEPLFNGTFKTGVDYISGYALLTNIGKIKRLIIGDYHAEFGQGLTFWNSLSFGKTSSPLSVRKRADGLVRHSSAYESGFLRGIGTTVPILKADLTVFASFKLIDANITDTLENDNLYFSSLPETGYHRTNSEIENRNSLRELTLGSNLTYNTRNFKAGVTFAYSKIDGEFNGNQSIYNLTPTHNQKTAIGFAADYTIRKHHLFGEVAADLPNMFMASIVGGLFRLSNTVQVSVLGRSYSRNFNSRFTAGFAEGSGTSNENGLYTGLSILPAKGWRLSGYIDLFKFPWLKYATNSPSVGKEFMSISEHTFSDEFSMNLRYRFKQTEKNLSSSTSAIVPVINQTNQSVRLQVNYKATSIVKLKTTLETAIFSTDSTKTERGYLFAQDVGLKINQLPVNINFRFAIFDTPSWNTRIYAYENDMLYSFTVPALYSKGTRIFVMLKYSPKPWIDLWLRYSQTFFSEMDEIGQGADLINSNSRSEIKAMARVKF